MEGETSRAREMAAAALAGARWEARRNELRSAWMLQSDDQINAELQRRGLRSRVSEPDRARSPSHKRIPDRWSGLPYMEYGKVKAVDAIVDDEMRGGQPGATPRLGQRGQPSQ
mmetsp:Transcript_36422/g.116972  ORF Transcript_36422/g.116972 Transcript_36422/m.116972 type:complete len:113 (+) Transcript_36422:390-728(+)